MHHRTSFLDFFKAIATQGIVIHHLISYGFIAYFSTLAIPLFRDCVYNYGRLLVQIFFVLGGFLAANKISKNVNVFKEIYKRFLRLASPYWVALFFVVLISLILKYNLSDDSLENWEWLSNLQSFNQVLSHVFLVHDIFSQENLSTGVWYIAIDFQLFVITMLLSFIYQKYNRDVMLKILYILIFISLFLIPKSLDYLGFYFFYSYGLGILIFSLRHKKNITNDIILITLLFIVSLILDFKIRVFISYFIGLFVFLIVKFRFNSIIFYNKIIIFLSKNSYSVFLTHFIIVMLMNFFINRNIEIFYDNNNYIIFTLFFSWLSAIILGEIFYRYVEKPLMRKINNS